MKKHCKNAYLLGLLLGAALLVLSGCGDIFPPIWLAEQATVPAVLEISLDPEKPEEISFNWKAPEWAEVAVDARRGEAERSVVVTVRLTPVS